MKRAEASRGTLCCGCAGKLTKTQTDADGERVELGGSEEVNNRLHPDETRSDELVSLKCTSL